MAEIPFSLGSFAAPGGDSFPALIIGDGVHRIDDPACAGGHAWPTMLSVFEDWPNALPALQQLARALRAEPGTRALRREELTALVPVSARQIFCAGANYRKHVIDIMIDHDQATSINVPPGQRRELAERIMDHRAAAGQPFAFTKPVSALLDPSASLQVPADSVETDWELELAVVIGKPARRVHRDQAMQHVAGYTIANDISARDHIARPDFPTLGMDWLACKSKPGFLPLGPQIVPAAFIENPQDVRITLLLNGEVMQDESTADMIFPICRLIEYISTHVQLLPGDVICTGSPSGNGTHHRRFLRPGDIMEGRIDGIGTLRTLCVAEPVAGDALLHRPFAPL